MANWSFNGPDLTNATATDRSGQGNDGTRTGGVAAAVGKVGQALRFDGVDDYVDAAAISTTPRTVSLWLKPTAAITSASTNMGIMDFDNNDGTANIFGYTGNLTGTFSGETITFTSNANVAATYITDSLDATWHHLVITNNGSVWNQVYLDGVAVTTNLAGGGAAVWNNDFQIGRGGYSSTPYYFDGLIDEVRVYSRSLSATEIKQLYDASK